MKRLAWLTDIHLNFLTPVQMEQFFGTLKDANADAFLITGDITEAPRLSWHLTRMEAYLARPIYFVLGNHDYYLSSFADVQMDVREVTRHSASLHWMNDAGVVELTPDIALIGHDGWADGRCGNYARSELMLTDYVAIKDLSGLSKERLLRTLNRLGDAAAGHFRTWLPKALAQYRHVFLMTHVPPFCETCWQHSRYSDDDFRPHFASRVVGEVLTEVMRRYPDCKLTVLSGHTHTHGKAYILPNLLVISGGAHYRRPEIQQIFEVD
jgi:predicted phosphohydrolase